MANGSRLPWLSGLDSEASKGKACFWGPPEQWGTVDGPGATSKSPSEQTGLGPRLAIACPWRLFQNHLPLWGLWALMGASPPGLDNVSVG